MTNRLIRRLCTGLIACLVASTPSLFAADVCLMEEAPFLAKSQPIFEDALRPGWTIDPYGANYGAFNTVVVTLGLQYTRDWGVVTLERSVPLNPLGIKALVFRIRGVEDTNLKQLWVILKNFAGQWMEQVPVAEHMVTPDQLPLPSNEYDTAKWYTVVIPMEVLNPSMTSFDSIVFMNGSVHQFYLDDIWLVVGMEFPLKEGENSNPAWQRTGYPDITAVFDHSQPGTSPIPYPFPHDSVVWAYTGERGDYAVHPTDPAGDCWNTSNPQYRFDVDRQYVGAEVCDNREYLAYDGHPGVDYSARAGTPVYAPEDGKILYTQCNSTTCTDTGKLVIVHPGPYTTVLEHLSRLRSGFSVGSPVTKGEVVAYSGDTGTGSAHLHMSTLLWYDSLDDMKVYVDPYGWSGTGYDPYQHRAVNVRLWKK